MELSVQQSCMYQHVGLLILTVQTSQVGHVPWLKIDATNRGSFSGDSSVRAGAVRTLSSTSHHSRAGQHHATPFGQV
jgi:hypothetical protein